MLGCIHGNERGDLAIITAQRQHEPSGVQLWIVPEMNPVRHCGRHEAQRPRPGLSRNFPRRWRPISDGAYYSRLRATTEPETQASVRLVSLLLRWRRGCMRPGLGRRSPTGGGTDVTQRDV